MSASKQKGTRAESAVVEFLKRNGFPKVERRTLSGAKDRGDIAGLDLPVVIEVKDHGRMELAQWVGEMLTEVTNADADVGAVFHKRRGKGSPSEWYVTMTGLDFLMLLRKWADLEAVV